MKWARAKYANNARGQIIGESTGMLKLIFRPENKQLLGVQIFGEGATELIHLGMSVLESGGAIDTFIESRLQFPHALRTLQIRSLRRPRQPGRPQSARGLSSTATLACAGFRSST